MTIEEKAKAYDEAIKIAKETYNTQPMYRNWLESMFHELQENEIKDMREKLIKAFGSIGKKEWGGVNVKDVIHWLEKQGEHDETSIAIKNPEAYRIGFADGEAHAKEEMNVWSDEDEMMLNELIIGFYGYKDQYPNFWKLRTDEIIEWLKKKKDEHTTDNG